MPPKEFVIWICSQPGLKTLDPPSEEEWREFRHQLSTTIGAMVAEKLTQVQYTKKRQ
jgi:hypothetical protein